MSDCDQLISVGLCTCDVQELIDPVNIRRVIISYRAFSGVIVIILIVCIDKKGSAKSFNYCKPTADSTPNQVNAFLPVVSSVSEITCSTFTGNRKLSNTTTAEIAHRLDLYLQRHPVQRQPAATAAAARLM